MIIEWTRDEEAKYQASLVSKEVELFRTEAAKSRESPGPSSRPGSSKKSSPSPDKASKKKQPLFEKDKGLFKII